MHDKNRYRARGIMNKTIFNKEYHGFEAASDISRDLHEMWDERFNPAMKGISGEFQGTVKVTVTYSDEETCPECQNNPNYLTLTDDLDTCPCRMCGGYEEMGRGHV
jgi:hypothetical protein